MLLFTNFVNIEYQGRLNITFCFQPTRKGQNNEKNLMAKRQIYIYISLTNINLNPCVYCCCRGITKLHVFNRTQLYTWPPIWASMSSWHVILCVNLLLFPNSAAYMEFLNFSFKVRIITGIVNRWHYFVYTGELSRQGLMMLKWQISKFQMKMLYIILYKTCMKTGCYSIPCNLAV